MTDSNPKSESKPWQFKPGQSGNPGGKNPEREALRRLILGEYGRKSVEGIAALAVNARSEKVRLDAYIWLAEQAVGKATQAISAPDGGPVVDVPALAVALRKAAGEDV